MTTDQTTTTGCAFADEGCTCGRPRLQLTEARTDTPHTFRTYLDATERDQLDARAATAEQERDDALQDRDEARQTAKDVYGTLKTIERERNEAIEARDCARQTAAFRQGVNDSLRQDLSDAGDVIAAVREAAERLDRALAGRLPSLPDIRAAVEHIDRALATYDTTPGESEPEREDGSPELVAEDIAAAIETHFLPDNLTAVQAARIARHHATQYGPAAVLGSPRRAQEPTAGEARRLLDQAIESALPLAGGRVRKLLKALRRELVRVDAKRAEKAEG